MNLDEMRALFIDSRKRGVFGARWEASPKTIKIYEHNLRVFINFLAAAGVSGYENLNRVHMMAFLDFLGGRVKSGEWSVSTRLQILRTMRAFFQWALLDDDCEKLVEHTVKLRKYMPKIQRSPQRTDIPENQALRDFNAKFDTGKVVEYRDYVACCLMAATAIRIGELCNLRLDDISWGDKLMVVEGKTTRSTGKRRLVPLPEDIIPKLKGWIKRRAELKSSDTSPYVFVSRLSPKMCPDAWSSHIARFRKKHNLPRISAHTFRHAFCTTYLAKGGTLQRLKNITGHTSYAILEGYVNKERMNNPEARAELEKVNLLRAL